ncbi:MAG: type II toxin-antitoxin system VapC family toxin [Myxococcota bacterium]|nr:type II toxin-antitoxin system VapC family toxin [Myxococcota bacterium]
MIVLDTHALLWWALDPAQLSATAVETCARMERDGGFASAISLWELAIEVKRGKLELPLSVGELAERIERSGVVELLAVDTKIWLRSAGLDWEHRDPADRVIVATALERGLPLLTKDSTLHAFDGATCVW